MKAFMDEDFLLSTPTAKILYHDYAEKMPIIDYHCHINPQEIAEDRRFDNIAQAWLGGDHYKWRLMRSNGADEKDITGAESTDREKFQKFAETLPKAIGNPMYHWTHLELKRYFGYSGVLNPDTAEEVWNLCNEKLKTLSVRKIIGQSNVKLICTTDDPSDDLRWHKAIREDPSCTVKVLPAWRPDKFVNIAKAPFRGAVQRLEQASGVSVRKMDDLYDALEKRLDFFASMGCVASDHGIDAPVYAPAGEMELDAILARGLAGAQITPEEAARYQYAVLMFLAREYAKRGWVMQIHYGALRSVNTGMVERLGPDTGFDIIAAQASAGDGLPRFLNALEREGSLPKTVLYSLSPNDNAYLDALIGAFQGTEIAGKVQHGAAWWFCDTKAGMEAHMTSLADLSLLGNFIGMLTDSRSYLSYTRHEYFRRILCCRIGEWVENGEYPWDEKYLGRMVQDISFNNTKRYFGFPV